MNEPRLPHARHVNGWRDSVRVTTRMLFIPQGFTLSVSGVSVALIGQRSYPGLLAIWLFVLGAGLSLAVCAFTTGAHRNDRHGNISSASAAVFNPAPVVVVPLSVGAFRFIDNRAFAFFVAGVAVAGLYVVVAAAFSLCAQRMSRARMKRPAWTPSRAVGVDSNHRANTKTKERGAASDRTGQ
jgi:hypothetical protein